MVPTSQPHGISAFPSKDKLLHTGWSNLNTIRKTLVRCEGWNEWGRGGHGVSIFVLIQYGIYVFYQVNALGENNEKSCYKNLL